MDAATVLDQFTQDLSNLPAELTFLLTELREKDMKYYDTRKRIQQRDNQLHKFIRLHGSLTKHPKEQQIYSKIEEDFEKAFKLQEEKLVFSNTALFSVTQHLTKLQDEIERLEKEGLIAPMDEILDHESSDLASFVGGSGMALDGLSLRSDRKSATPTSTSTTGMAMGSAAINGHKRTLSRRGGHQSSASISRTSTPSLATNGLYQSGRPTKKLKTDELSDNDINNKLSSTLKRSSVADITATTGLDGSTFPTTSTNNGKGLVLASSANTPNSAHKPLNGNINLIVHGGATGGEEDELYCFCRQVSFGNMIACDNANCKYEWFHYDCVGLKEPPQGTWYCPDCAVIMANSNNNANKKGRKKK
ncbi:hypothetical protein PACTADRAFT_79643 [Pachysolen tannophilus NRRL Y-2460]|uniref:Chromatin modification-related protein n=1 Tax=Pachysolen tannophilus NRRL Y-2460 TaxID=669874 RepID=A0A1E4TZS7_PACTA|nr:hypothetical protein PACTADRAFT_79643 [Pachysolen tannophilus NRRL Y-2460]